MYLGGGTGLFLGRPGCVPATTEGRNDGTAEIGEVRVGERNMICAPRQGADQGFDEAPECVEFLLKAEVERASIRSNDHERNVVVVEILGETLSDFPEQRRDQLLRRDVAKEINDTQQAFFAEHFAVGVTGFDERVRIADEAITGVEFDIELLVLGDLKDAKWKVAWPLLFEVILVAKKGPTPIDDAKQKRARMARIAKREAASRCEESRDNSGGETAMAGKSGELFIEQANQFCLIEAIDEAAHQGAQVGCRGGNRGPVAGNVGQEQAADAAGGAAGDIIDIASPLGLAEWLAVDPNIQPTQFDTARGQLAPAPHLHALHVLRGQTAHAGIIMRPSAPTELRLRSEAWCSGPRSCSRASSLRAACNLGDAP
jgi:hypothetical protein